MGRWLKVVVPGGAVGAAGCQDGRVRQAGTWRSFVALGDSFTEGLDDPYPDGRGYRGWADLVAARLAGVVGSDFRYANLAVRGRLFPRVVAEQVPAALAMKPDLVSFAAGGNDVLRRNFDPDTLMRQFDEVIGEIRKGGADVVLFRFADLAVRLPARRMIGPRVAIMNRLVMETGERHGALVVDLWRDPVFLNSRMWSTDRLHLSELGHRRVAAGVLDALGVDADPRWLVAVPEPERLGWTAARAADARWVARHLAPWLKRRLMGQSSGDLVQPKRPELTPPVPES
jgi:lysophospholipase L1-like esterase